MKKILLLVSLSLTISILVLLKIKTQPDVIQKPQEQQQKEHSFDEAIGLISSKECLENVSYLASDELEGRMSGKKGNVLALEYLKSKLEKHGLKTVKQKFNINRVNPGPNKEEGNDFTENLYAWIEGSSLKNEIVVVGAHFDHIGYGPKYSRSSSVSVHNGADDNASGTVAVLEVAKAMSKLKPERTVVFQFYSAEEMGLLGSRYYCNNPLFPLENPSIDSHVVMINLDMVGHLKQDQYKVSVPESVDIKSTLNKLSEKYPFSKNIRATGGGSDHASFNNKKIPTIFLHTGLNKFYHTPEDDVETLNIAGIVEISKFTFELTWIFANQEKPKFNQVKFKEMPYTHDHDSGKF